jgi:transposase
MEDWAMIKLLHKQGVSKLRIAKELGVDRKTVDRALAEDMAKGYQRVPAVSKLDPFKDHIVERLSKYDLTATKLFQEIQDKGYAGSYDTVKRYVREIRPPRPVEAFVRFETEPGEQSQVDWGSFGLIRHQGQMKRLYCFSLLLCYSRFMYIEFTVSQSLQTLLGCHINAFNFTGGVTRSILYDNMKTVVISREGRHIKWNPQFLDFASFYRFTPSLCAPYRKETKGKVEKSISYIRQNFFNGLEFTDLEDLNAHALVWLQQTANVRVHRTTLKVPAERLLQEGLSPLPEQEYLLDIPLKRKSYKDFHVYYEGNRYSVPHYYAGKEVHLKPQGNRLFIYYQSELITLHDISPLKGKIFTLPEHREGLERNTYPGTAAQIQEEFLSFFPEQEHFIEELKKQKYGNARYHLHKIMALLEEYPKEVVQYAVKRAANHLACDAATVRNICDQTYQTEIEIEEPKPLHIQPFEVEVDRRSLDYYSRFEEGDHGH